MVLSEFSGENKYIKQFVCVFASCFNKGSFREGTYDGNRSLQVVASVLVLSVTCVDCAIDETASEERVNQEAKS